MLAQQAKITLINITANQPKTGWSIPSDWDLPKGAIVPVAPSGMQPINPNDPNKSNTPDLTPIIIGLITVTLGVAVDKLTASQKEQLQADGHTLPSSAPNSTAQPNGTPETPDPNADADTKRGLEKQQLNSQIMSQLGYVVVNQPKQFYGGLLPSHTQIDPLLDNSKNPDHEIEGRIFDSLAIKENELSNPSNDAMNARSKIEKKVGDGQAQRILLNLDDSRLKLEDLKQVLIDNPIPDLKEIIIIKNGQVILFFPFK